MQSTTPSPSLSGEAEVEASLGHASLQSATPSPSESTLLEHGMAHVAPVNPLGHEHTASVSVDVHEAPLRQGLGAQ